MEPIGANSFDCWPMFLYWILCFAKSCVIVATSSLEMKSMYYPLGSHSLSIVILSVVRTQFCGCIVATKLTKYCLNVATKNPTLTLPSHAPFPTGQCHGN